MSVLSLGPPGMSLPKSISAFLYKFSRSALFFSFNLSNSVVKFENALKFIIVLLMDWVSAISSVLFVREFILFSMAARLA